MKRLCVLLLLAIFLGVCSGALAMEKDEYLNLLFTALAPETSAGVRDACFTAFIVSIDLYTSVNQSQFAVDIRDMARAYDKHDMDAKAAAYEALKADLVSDDAKSAALFLTLIDAYYSTYNEEERAFIFEDLCNLFYPNYSSAASSNSRSDQQTTDGDISYSASSTYLPDPHYFFRENLKHGEYDITGGLEIHFILHRNNEQAVKEYIQLLQDSRFNMKLKKTDSLNAGICTETFYIFSYTGTTDVSEIARTLSKTAYGDGTPYQAPVIIGTRDYPRYGWLMFSIYCARDFIFIDAQDRSSVKAFTDPGILPNEPFLGPVVGHAVTVSGSGAGSDVPDYDSSYGSSLDCSFCIGSGDCQTCDGYGYVYSINGRRDKNCNSCGTSGRCSHCGGSGKR